MRRVVVLSSTSILFLLLSCAPALAQTLISVKLVRGERESVTRGVENKCHAPHTFELKASPDIEWFHTGGVSRRLIAPGTVGEFVFEFDSAGMDNGTYTEEVSIDCLDCAKERCAPARFPYTLQLSVTRPADDRELVEIGADDFIAGQVLAALHAKTRKTAEATARSLALKYGLQSLCVFELRSISLFFVHFAILDPAVSVASVVTRLELDPLVNYAQHVYRYFGSAAAPQLDYTGRQYALRLTRADLAQKFSDGRNVKIALLDSWVDTQHGDLRGRVVLGRDFTGEVASPEDVHGTIIAGIIVAKAHNGLGIDGVAPGARIVSFKVLSQTSPRGEPEGTPITVGKGLDFAILSKFRLINLSNGSPGRDKTMVRLVKKARSRGVVLVAAAGNGGHGGRALCPAALDEVIAVAAVDNNSNFYAKGTRGEYIDLAAPGVNILSTWPNNVYQYEDGSSLAAAHVTGVVALLLSKRPRTSPIAIQRVLESTARGLGGWGRDDAFGNGLVDACRALEVLAGDGSCR